MIEFILNNDLIQTDFPSGSILLNFIRKEKNLTGTKIGCREGDCGACTVLIGSVNQGGEMNYKSVVSCLTSIASVHQKHVVTIEGLNFTNKLSPIQEIFKNNNATQCGFCTPGFIVSLTGFTFNSNTSIPGIKESISGNICRCTGYKSIEKSTHEILDYIQNIDGNISSLIDKGILPEYFSEVGERLSRIEKLPKSNNKQPLVGGGTDLYVTHGYELEDQDVNLVANHNGNIIHFENGHCIIECQATATDIVENVELVKYFDELKDFFKLISSQQIRNTGTLGGNLVNASPIADLAIFFLALNSKINIQKGESIRNIFLRDFFKDYKTIDLQEDEILQSLVFETPVGNDFFNFEKVSKRTHLDIASVNSAIKITIDKNIISDIHISMGGVSPIPLNLKNTNSFLIGKELTSINIRKGHCVLKEEISPIDDVRGSREYKQLLARQLYFAHFIKLFPEIISINDIL